MSNPLRRVLAPLVQLSQRQLDEASSTTLEDLLRQGDPRVTPEMLGWARSREIAAEQSAEELRREEQRQAAVQGVLEEIGAVPPPVPDLEVLIAAVHAAFDELVAYGARYNSVVSGLRKRLAGLGVRQDEHQAVTTRGRTLRALALPILLERIGYDVLHRHHLQGSHTRQPELHAEVGAQLRGMDRVAS